MIKRGHDTSDKCATLLDALESVDPLAEFGAPQTAESFRLSLLRELPDDIRTHLTVCSTCREIVDDFAGTREALQPLAFEIAAQQPGPWFAGKVMNAIRAQENEMDLKDAVWISVRRLAPRLAALCAALLLVMGTWIAREIRIDQSRNAEMRGPESVFDSSSLPLNDDVLVYSQEGAR